MRTLTFINANQESLTFREAFPYLITELDLGDPQVTTMQDKNYNQDGVQYYGSRLDERIIDFSLCLEGASEEDVLNMRRKAYSVLNPRLGLGTLIYDDGYSRWRINATVTYLTTRDEIDETIKELDVGMNAPDPAWESEIQHAIKLVGSIGGLTFPKRYPISYARQGDQCQINYQGTLDAPLLIEFRGPANMPKIMKKESGEFIEVDVDIMEGERLYISTVPTAIDAYIVDATGEERPAFHYIKPVQSYLQLTQGMNTISFRSATGSPEVYLYWRDRYVGV